MKVLSVDSSSTHCGYSVFEDNKIKYFSTESFTKVTFNDDKLKDICLWFRKIVTEENPSIILIEEPLVYAKFSSSIATLNKVGGALFGVSVALSIPVVFIHGQTVKKVLKFKTKEESISIAKRYLGLTEFDILTEHEADSVNLYRAYKTLGDKLVQDFEKAVGRPI